MEKSKFIALVEALHAAGFDMASFTPDTRPAVYADAVTGRLQAATGRLETATLQISPVTSPDPAGRPDD
jgi:hypothetical protein